MNKETSDRVRENNSEEVPKISPVATTSFQQNEPTTTDAEMGHTSRWTHQRNFFSRLSLRNFIKLFKSYVLSSEDEIHLQCALRKNYGLNAPEKEPMFVIVDSSGLSNPSSKELVIERKPNHNNDTKFAKFFNKRVIPIDFPSTSKDYIATDIFHYPSVLESVSRDELQMMDINLQSDNDISLEDFDENDSIVISYLRSKNIVSEMDGALLLTKKKPSLLESLPKLETIVEGKQFTGYPEKSDQTLDIQLDEEDQKEQC